MTMRLALTGLCVFGCRFGTNPFALLSPRIRIRSFRATRHKHHETKRTYDRYHRHTTTSLDHLQPPVHGVAVSSIDRTLPVGSDPIAATEGLRTPEKTRSRSRMASAQCYPQSGVAAGAANRRRERVQPTVPPECQVLERGDEGQGKPERQRCCRWSTLERRQVALRESA